MTQIVLDNTLAQNAIATSQDKIVNISGGTQTGKNLFYSFESFSVASGETVSLQTGSEIENIFLRITGNGITNIDGIIKIQGNANLFLLNPNGITLEENVSLDIGGSFVGTTASSIKFADGKQFSIDDANQDPILTASLPIGLRFTGNERGLIAVRGKGSNIGRQPDIAQFNPFERGESLTGISVRSRKSLALIGGKINIEGGRLNAESGQIHLGSVNSK
ncbi:MAG: filamentous hemagglutinin N-terminal domain-containing protein [Waterburya sp.]